MPSPKRSSKHNTSITVGGLVSTLAMMALAAMDDTPELVGLVFVYLLLGVLVDDIKKMSAAEAGARAAQDNRGTYTLLLEPEWQCLEAQDDIQEGKKKWCLKITRYQLLEWALLALLAASFVTAVSFANEASYFVLIAMAVVTAGVMTAGRLSWRPLTEHSRGEPDAYALRIRSAITPTYMVILATLFIAVTPILDDIGLSAYTIPTDAHFLVGMLVMQVGVALAGLAYAVKQWSCAMDETRAGALPKWAGVTMMLLPLGQAALTALPLFGVHASPFALLALSLFSAVTLVVGMEWICNVLFANRIGATGPGMAASSGDLQPHHQGQPGPVPAPVVSARGHQAQPSA